MKLRIVMALVAATVILAGCGQSAQPTVTPVPTNTAVPPTPAGDALSLDALANAQYQSEFTQSGTVTLVDGEFREPVAPGSATETVVKMTEHVARGQINGQPVAAVVLVADPGGSGTFYDLALMVDQAGIPVNIASTSLGDRVQVHSVTIADGVIAVNMVAFGPDDPMCCPTQQVLNTYALEGDQLVEASSQIIGGDAGEGSDPVANIGIDPVQIGLDSQGLPYAWQANAVAATPYDETQPGNPVGLPNHIQVNFGTLDPAQVQPQDPILYIVPVRAYQEQWEAANNQTVTEMVQAIYQQIMTDPNLAPTSGLPILPFERLNGVNDLAVAVNAVPTSDLSASKSGYRFVGRIAQSPVPVANETMQYIYQGFTNDGEYLVLFFYPPVGTTNLPATGGEAPQAEIDQVATDPATYTAGKAAALNGLPPEAWAPDLRTLDALVASLTIANVPMHGVEGMVWQLAAVSDGTQEIPVDNSANYFISFLPNQRIAFEADCKSGTGFYNASGGMVGSLAVSLEPFIQVECGPGSYSNVLIDTLSTAQTFRIRPGGQYLELVRASDGDYLLLRAVGPTDLVPEQPEQPPVALPTPAPQGPYGRVIAPDGVNLRAGPGTYYPVLGFAPLGTEGIIIGRSADSQWWAASAPSLPRGVAWVAAPYVEVFNVEGVPMLPPPPPPVPGPVPTAAPVTATPPPQIRINLSADPTVIERGQCTTLSWDVENVQAVWVYPLGEPFENYPETGQASRQECPTESTTYEMRVLLTNGQLELRQVSITVNATNPLAGTSWVPTSLRGQPLIAATDPLSLAMSEDTVTGNTGCNTFNGAYGVNGSTLTIGPLATTQQVCGDAAMDQQEAVYLEALQATASYSIDSNQLILFDGSGIELVRLNLTGG